VCSAMDDEEAAFTCPPRECGGYSEGFCGNRPVLGDDGMAADDECLPCDAVEVVITPKETHVATQAAIGEAETALEYSRKRIAGKKQHDVIDAALARLRALGKG